MTSSWPSGPPKEAKRMASYCWGVVIGTPPRRGGRSGEQGGDVLEGLEAASGVEGELVAHVQARVGVAQVGHHVDEGVQVVRLGGENPVVGGEGEGGDGVSVELRAGAARQAVR